MSLFHALHALFHRHASLFKCKSRTSLYSLTHTSMGQEDPNGPYLLEDLLFTDGLEMPHIDIREEISREEALRRRREKRRRMFERQKYTLTTEVIRQLQKAYL